MKVKWLIYSLTVSSHVDYANMNMGAQMYLHTYFQIKSYEAFAETFFFSLLFSIEMFTFTLF